jgi:membrane-associated phospholipid phosphatase
LRPIAHIISLVFHPLLLATYLLLLLGFYFPALFAISQRGFRVVLAFVFCFTFILPVVNLLMFGYFGSISSYTLQERRERLFPVSAVAVIYVVMALLFYYKLPISINFNRIIGVLTVMVVAAAVITFFYKISIHSLGAGGVVGMLLPLNKAMEDNLLLWPTAIAMVTAGAIMSARLYLDAHTPREVLYGALAGFLIGFGGIVLLF